MTLGKFLTLSEAGRAGPGMAAGRPKGVRCGTYGLRQPMLAEQ